MASVLEVHDTAANKDLPYRKTVVCVILNSDGTKALMFSRNAKTENCYEFPQGGYDINDKNKRHTAYRELFEETGISSDMITDIPYYGTCLGNSLEVPFVYHTEQSTRPFNQTDENGNLNLFGGMEYSVFLFKIKPQYQQYSIPLDMATDDDFCASIWVNINDIYTSSHQHKKHLNKLIKNKLAQLKNI